MRRFARRPLPWAALSTCLLVFGLSARAHACAPCGAGDPTLVVAGSERPWSGRVRMGSVVQIASYIDEDAAVDERRATLGVAIALSDVALFALTMPLVWRETVYPSLARDTTVAPGDADVRVRTLLARDRPFAPAHQLSIDLGARLPTAPLLADQGVPLPIHAQTGTGAPEPMLGLLWTSFLGETSLWLSALGSFPMTGFSGWRNGVALRTSAFVQWQVAPWLALRCGLDSRVEESVATSVERERAGPSWILFPALGVAVAPQSDSVLHLLLRVPLVVVRDEAHPGRNEGLAFEAGVAVDA